MVLCIVVCMPRVNISIPAMKLKRIDTFCNEKNIPRSVLLVRGAMSIVNSQPVQNCEFCKNPSIGKFSILSQTWDRGEIKLEKYLCAFHLNKARSESEISEI